MESKVLTILFTDMKGFTERSGTRTRREVLDIVQRHDGLLRPIILRFGGRVVKTIGDAFFAVFESPTNAVHCGLLMQATLRDYNAAAPESARMEVRVAINTGEVQITTDDIFGEPVNVASRINTITEPGEVYFTHAVYLAMNKTEVPSSEVGERILKGVPEPIKVYRLIQDDASDQYRRILETVRGRALEPSEAERRSRIGDRRRSRPWVLAAAALALAGGSSWATWWWTQRSDWAQEAREAARAGGWVQAWERVDRRFAERPADPRIPDLARELAEAQVAAFAATGDHAQALTWLESQRKDRGYIPGLDALADRVLLEQASRLMARGGQSWNEALDLLWKRHEKLPEVGRRLLDYALAADQAPQRYVSKIVEHIAAALRLDPTLAAESRVRETLLRYAEKNELSPTSGDGPTLWEMIARQYPEEAIARFRPRVNLDSEVPARLHAYGVCSRIAEIPVAEQFEYHRLNLFQCVDFFDEFHDQATDYFVKNWLDKPEAVKPFTHDQHYDGLPILEKYGTAQVENAIGVIGVLFYEPCLRFLLDHVLEPGNVPLRYSCHRLLDAKGHVTAETRHRYHLLNLEEYGSNQLRYSYPWIADAFAYLQSDRIEGDAWRAEALDLVERKRTSLQEALADRSVKKDEDVTRRFGENLDKARANLTRSR